MVSLLWPWVQSLVRELLKTASTAKKMTMFRSLLQPQTEECSGSFFLAQMPSGDHFLSAHLTSMLLVKPGPQNPYTERTFMPSRFGRTELQTILKDMFLLFFFRASICKKLPASISSKLCQRSNANTSCCILAHPYLFPLFRMENPAAYIHGVCA